MKTETRQYTIYDWEALPDDGKRAALDRYRHTLVEHYDIDDWLDSEYLRNHPHIELPQWASLDSIGYCIGSGRGDGASLKLSFDNRALLQHYANLNPKYNKLVLLSDYILFRCDSNGYGYQYFDRYGVFYEIDSQTSAPRVVALVEEVLVQLREDKANLDRATYKVLAEDYNSLTEDSSIEEFLKDNDYMFTIDGKIAQ